MFLIHNYESQVMVGEEYRRTRSQDYISLAVAYGLCSTPSACSGLCRMEHQQPFSEVLVKALLELAAQGYFRNQIQHVLSV